MDAKNLFESPALPKQPLRRNNFGGVLSGRIIRNKLFFTTNYEGYIERSSAQAFATYPTALMKQGILTEPFFHSGNSANGQPTPIIDPLTGAPFPGNIIPQDRISPQAQKLMQFLPASNYGPAQFTGAVNYNGSTLHNTGDHQGFARVDYNISDRDRVFGRYGIENNTLFSTQVNPNPFFGQNQPKIQQNAVFTYTRLVSPTKLNEFSLSYNRDTWGTLDTVPQGFNIAQDLLIPGLNNDPYVQGVPTISITGLTGLGNTTPTTIWDENRRLADTFSLTHGAHTLKLGIDFQHVLVRRQSFTYVTGQFNFNGSMSGAAWADFLLDQPYQVEEAVSPNPPVPGHPPGQTYVRLFDWRLHSFVTDDWKATQKLTLSLGLRWELNSPIRDIRGLTPNINMNTGEIFPAPGVPGNLYEWDHHDFAPRFGLAYRPFGGNNIVVRASYGVFYSVNMWNNVSVMAVNPPFNVSINQLNTPGHVSISMAVPPNASATVVGGATPEVLGVPWDYGMGNAQQWTFNIQRSLPSNMTLEVGYVGSKSTHFDRPAEYNDINVLAGQTTRAFPQWGDIELIDSDASGSYEALITKLQKRLSNNLTFLFTYTFSKALFDSFAGNGANRLSNPFDALAEKGRAETDQRHRVTASWLYELPFFRGQSGFAGHVLGGWQANGVFTFATGLPFYVIQTVQPVADGCPRCTRRPDVLGDPTLNAPTTQEWFNTSDFVVARGHYGNEGRNILSAPGLVNLDCSLFKNFKLTETKRIQFRWEAYNVSNTPPLNPPDATLGDGTFGQVLSAGNGRIMQVALRYEF